MNARLTAVDDLERNLDYTFKDRALLERALTHASVSEGAKTDLGDYERLEFLGDRVLGLIVADRLMERYPQADEGELSKRLHALVSRDACARVAETLGVGAALRLAAGESKLGGRRNRSILGDACEALIAAVYRDGGLECVRRVFGPAWEREIDQLGSVESHNPKSGVQEWAAARGHGNPVYAVTGREGPDHAPRFTVELRIEGVEPMTGAGRSRQDAEKAVAAALLEREGLL